MTSNVLLYSLNTSRTPEGVGIDSLPANHLRQFSDKMRMLSHLFVGIGLTCLTAAQFSENAQGLFDESMEWMDAFYDSKAGYLYDLDGNQALRHNTRSSSFYAVGLLARNEGEDASEAEKIILNLIGGQFTDPEKQWLECTWASKFIWLMT